MTALLEYLNLYKRAHVNVPETNANFATINCCATAVVLTITHLCAVVLRSTNLEIKRGLPETFETLSLCHYGRKLNLTCYLSLAEAVLICFHESYSHIE